MGNTIQGLGMYGANDLFPGGRGPTGQTMGAAPAPRGASVATPATPPTGAGFPAGNALYWWIAGVAFLVFTRFAYEMAEQHPGND